jgi:hypothetical protein
VVMFRPSISCTVRETSFAVGRDRETIPRSALLMKREFADGS